MRHLFAKSYQTRPIRFKWKVHNFEEKNEGSTVLVLILLLLLGRMLTGLWSRLFKEKSCLPPDHITMMKTWGPDDQFCHYLEQNMNSSILPHFILSTIISCANVVKTAAMLYLKLPIIRNEYLSIKAKTFPFQKKLIPKPNSKMNQSIV